MTLTLERLGEAAPRVARRPFGLYVIAALQALNAVSHGFGVFAGVEDTVLRGLTDFEANLLATAETIIGLVIAAGLLMLSRTAWVAAMLWVGAIMAVEILLYLRGDEASHLVMAISLAQVFYLNQSDVQAAFRRGSGGV